MTKRRIVEAIIVVVALVGMVVVVTVFAKPRVINAGIPNASSSETSSTVSVESTVSVPDIVVSESASEAASKATSSESVASKAPQLDANSTVSTAPPKAPPKDEKVVAPPKKDVPKPNPPKQTGPKDGDTKVENGITYVWIAKLQEWAGTGNGTHNEVTIQTEPVPCPECGTLGDCSCTGNAHM